MSTAFCSFLPLPCGKIFYIIIYIKNDIKNYIKNSSEMAVMEGVDSIGLTLKKSARFPSRFFLLAYDSKIT